MLVAHLLHLEGILLGMDPLSIMVNSSNLQETSISIAEVYPYTSIVYVLDQAGFGGL